MERITVECSWNSTQRALCGAFGKNLPGAGPSLANVLIHFLVWPNVSYGRLVPLGTLWREMLSECYSSPIAMSFSLVPVLYADGCTNIPDIPHASWLQNLPSKKEDVYPVGATLQYRCHPGYEPATRERTTLVCQKDLTWSPFKGCKGEFWFSGYVYILNV